MLLLLTIAALLPREVKSDYIEPVVEVIEVPSSVKPQYVENYLLVYKAFKDTPVMIAIADAESDFNASAKNPHSSASGLFQIIKGTWKAYECVGDPFNPTDNIECAKKIYEDSGTSPWNESKHVWGV